MAPTFLPSGQVKLKAPLSASIKGGSSYHVSTLLEQVDAIEATLGVEKELAKRLTFDEVCSQTPCAPRLTRVGEPVHQGHACLLPRGGRADRAGAD